MKRVAGRSLALAVVALLLLSVVEAADNSMSIWQARRQVAGGIVASYSYSYIAAVDPGSFRFARDSFEFDAALQRKKNREHFKVDLRSLVPVFAQRGVAGHYRVKDEAGRDLPAPLNRMLFSEKVAESLAGALNRLRALANDNTSPQRTRERAEAWRALPSKPPLPEEVREKRLLAENAVKEKRPFEALKYYEDGLELHPTWPQGLFNAALIASELGQYAEAIEHMQAYLELVPDAPDAQSARDQIVIWRSKAK